VVYGIPEPPLVILVLDIAPHLVHLGFASFIPREYLRHNTGHIYGAYVCYINRAYGIFRFFKVSITLSVDMPKTLDISLMPEALDVISIIRSSMPGFAPS